MYEIVMPQLSDSMDEGKLVSWKVKVGERVSVGQVIAEVESDKAIMEVQAFKSGVVKELRFKEDQEAPVGTVMAVIDTGNSAVLEEKMQEKPEPKEEKAVEKKEELQVKKETRTQTQSAQTESKKVVPRKSKEMQRGISPKARAKAAAYGVELEKVRQNIAQTPVHASDVDGYIEEKYFTAKALRLMQEYHLDTSYFELNHKIDSDEVQEYIEVNELLRPLPLSAMQKAIISNVTAAAQKPIFHIYEYLDSSLFEKNSQYSITMWLVRILAKVMMQHESFRSKLEDEVLLVSTNAALSVAVANEKDLYMPVVHKANKLSMKELSEQFQSLKTKLQTKTFTQKDMQGSSFGISNLGMLGVASFDAMINKDDVAILAVGAINEEKISITLTCDHRVINGYEAALFMSDLKKEVQNPLNFKE